MSLHNFISITSTIALFLPVLVIVSLRLFSNKSYLLLAIYYLLAFIYNLVTAGVWNLSIETRRTAALINNFLDVPLMMGFLLYFTTSWRLSKQMKAVILLFAAFEVIVLATIGATFDKSTVILGPGILVIISFCGYFFIKQMQVRLNEFQEIGKILILSSLLFSYGCFSIVYLFHYILKTPNRADVFLVYYLITIIASLLITFGIWKERKKITQTEADKVLSQDKKVQSLRVVGKPSQPYKDENEFRYK
ncbi:MAG TPA: hypothetical protein VIQ00_11640 [Chitinophagaceae bacterium]|jgi:hypothetical protein